MIEKGAFIVLDDRCKSVPIDFYFRNITTIPGDKPTAKVELVSTSPIPKKAIYSGPATVVLWADGTKTVVKCSDEDAYAPEVGFLWALAEKVYGSKSQVDKVMGRWLRDAGQER